MTVTLERLLDKPTHSKRVAGHSVMANLPPVTLILPIHSEKRWDLFVAAMSALAEQEPAPAAIVVAVDHNPQLLRRIAARFPDVNTVENAFAPGASGTRNSGAAVADTPLLLFLDSDIVVREGWLRRLLEPFADPRVVGTGGFVAPRWVAPAPSWFPDEFGWVVGVSYRGLPTVTSPVRNVWSGNMAVRRDAFTFVHGFRVDFSKVNNSPKPEDTDFCVRVTRGSRGGTWMFVPDAVVDHEVGPERCHFGFFVRRCFTEGLGKVQLAHLNAGRQDLQDEVNYIRHTAPAGARRYARAAIRHKDGNSLRRSAAIMAGLGAAALGAMAAQAKYVVSRS
jgi:GT2 family glycosyltransferase